MSDNVKRAKRNGVYVLVKAWTTRWSVRLTALVFFSTLFLAHIHLIENTASLASIYVIIVLFLSEQLIEFITQKAQDVQDQGDMISSSFDGGLDKILSETISIKKTMGLIYDHKTIKLFGLTEFLEDLANMLQRADLKSDLIIEHLGLDMTQAWEHVNSRLLQRPRFANTDYRFLIISSDESKYKDEELRSWTRSVPTQKKKMANGMPKIKQAFEQDSKRFTSEGREYADIPVVHGVHIRGAIDVYYIAFCRWDRKESDNFDWGGMKYYRIVGPDIENPVHEDLTKVFDTYFNHLWHSSETIAFLKC